MAFDAYGSPSYGLSDVKIAPWTAEGTWGSAQDVMAAQALNTVIRVVSAELTGDDTIVAQASRPVGAQITFRMGGVTLGVLEIMTGNSATSSVATPNAVKNLRIAGGERFPYFALCGKALAEEGQGSMEVFIPKCKIMGDLNLVQMEYGAFTIPEFQVMAVADGDYGIVNIIQVETARAITIPPANIPEIA